MMHRSALSSYRGSMSPQAADRAQSRSGADPGGTPTTLPRSIVLLLGILGVVGMCIGIKAGAGIIAPTMLALVLTFAVLPIDRWARRHRWPGALATLTALVAAYVILLVMIVGTVVCLIKFVDILPTYAKEAKELTKSLQGDLTKLGVGTEIDE